MDNDEAAQKRRYDAVVVGGGLAGLTAARLLGHAGRSVAVLEADVKVGGRMKAQPVLGGGSTPRACVDLGGQWVGPSQWAIRDLAASLGVVERPTPHHGHAILIWKGKRCVFDGGFPPFDNANHPPVSDEEFQDAVQLWRKLEHLKYSWWPRGEPWDADEARDWDAELLSDWLARSAKTEFGRFTITLIARLGGSGAYEPHQVSLLHQLLTQRISPQVEKPETWIFKGCAGQIPQLIAQEFASPDSRVQVFCDAEVTEIVQPDEGGVIVESQAGRFRASKAIVAMPPCRAGKITYKPPLPDDQRALVDEAPMGKIIKVHAIYEDPFWLCDGLCGEVVGDLETIQFAADSSPEQPGVGILTGFMAGDRADELSRVSIEMRRDLVLEDYASYLGKKALDPIEYIEKNWPVQRWVGGAFTAFMKPGAWTGWKPGLPPPPLGNIYWAGTETANRWNGYFDGAVRSAEAAASAVLSALPLASWEPLPTAQA